MPRRRPARWWLRPSRASSPTSTSAFPTTPRLRRSCWPRPAIPTASRSAMNCPNDRYVNDSEICQAVAANLARIGVKVNLPAETKASYFPKILSRDTSFYMLGWTPSTVDSHNVLTALMATPNDKGQGQFNLGSYSNPKVDELDAEDPERDRPRQAHRDDPRGLRDPLERRRPHPAAPAGAGLGDEEERRAGRSCPTTSCPTNGSSSSDVGR